MSTHTILVVEDEDESRQALVEILDFYGFQAVGVANGAEAMDYLRVSETPPLIILDLLMPVMSGSRLRAALLQAPDLANIPVIVVSALDSFAVTEFGAVRTFTKPLDIDALVRVVRKYCL